MRPDSSKEVSLAVIVMDEAKSGLGLAPTLLCTVVAYFGNGETGRGGTGGRDVRDHEHAAKTSPVFTASSSDETEFRRGGIHLV